MKKVKKAYRPRFKQLKIDRIQAAYSADILYVMTLMLSKVSTAIFYKTITMRNSQRVLHALLGIIAVSSPAALTLSAVRCSSQPWQDINKECNILVSFGF